MCGAILVALYHTLKSATQNGLVLNCAISPNIDSNQELIYWPPSVIQGTCDNEHYAHNPVFDFDGDLYGRHLRIQLIDFIRDEKKFDGLDELKAQIALDGENAKRILAAEQ